MIAALSVTYTIGTSNAEILVDIDGSAEPWDPEDGTGPRSVSTTVNILDSGASGSTLTITPTSGATSTDIDHSSGYSGKQHTIVSNRNELEPIADFTLQATGSKYIEGGLSADFSVGNSDASEYIDVAITGTTATDDGGVTRITGQVLTRANDARSASEDISVLLDRSIVDDISEDNVITAFNFGSNVIATKGETRLLKVYGTPGATGTLNVKKDTVSETGYPVSIEIPKSGVYEDVFTFSELKSTTTNAAWEISIQATNSTTLSSSIPGNGRLSAIQYRHVSLSVEVDLTSFGSNTTPTTLQPEVFEGPAYTDGNDLAYLGFDSVRTVQYTVVNNVNTWSAAPGIDLTNFDREFTNTDSSTNGGTDFRIIKENISLSGSTAVITYTIVFNAFGNDRCFKQLDLSRIIQGR